MQNSERLIILIQTAYEENWSKVLYDLFFTDKRIILIHKKSKLDSNYGTVIGGAVGGVFGAVVGSVIKNVADSSKKENSDFSPSLDDLLKVDKKNLAVSYQDIEWFKLNRSKWERCCIVFKTGNKIRTLYLFDERADQLFNALPHIANLNKKLVK
jgi:hypothetical protein